MNRSLSARKSVLSGKALESLVATANATYKSKGLAYLERLHTGTAIASSGACLYRHKVWADFVGLIAGIPTRRRSVASPVLVECKARKDLFYTPVRKEPRVIQFNKLLEPHQHEACDRWESMGGEAYVVMYSSDKDGKPVMVSSPFLVGGFIVEEYLEGCRVHVRRGVYDYLNLL